MLVALDAFDKQCVLAAREGYDHTCVQITSKSSGDLCWYADIATRLRGRAFSLQLGSGTEYVGEAYIMAVPIILGDTPCSIWITCPGVWTYIFTETFDG